MDVRMPADASGSSSQIHTSISKRPISIYCRLLARQKRARDSLYSHLLRFYQKKGKICESPFSILFGSYFTFQSLYSAHHVTIPGISVALVSYDKPFLDLNHLQPDDSLEPPSSQQTVVSTSPSDCTAPFRYSSATTSLERVGPTLQRYWILYNTDPVMEEFRKQFVDWWLTTEFGARKELQTTIRWDGKKKSDVWERFDQVAHEKTGEPKVKCKQCHAIIVHPNHHRAGSSPMKGHLTTSTCLCRPKATKRRIDQLLRHSVSSQYSTPYLFH